MNFIFFMIGENRMGKTKALKDSLIKKLQTINHGKSVAYYSRRVKISFKKIHLN